MIFWSRLIGGFLAGKLTALRHGRSPDHVRSCAECMAALRRERQYLERLRTASIPAASENLTARLLERTHRLAQEPQFALQEPRSNVKEPVAAHSGPAPGLVVLVSSAAAALFAAALLAVAAYVVAGDRPIYAGGGSDRGSGLPSLAAGLPGQRTGETVQGSGQALPQAGPAPTPEGGRELSVAALAELRTAGWACPELRALGFHLDHVRATEQNGRVAVELHLSNGRHQATVVEEHDADGSVQLGADRLVVLQENPWRAAYVSPSGKITFSTDLPAQQADDALAQMRQAGESLRSMAPGTPEETLPARLQRGLGTIAGLVGF